MRKNKIIFIILTILIILANTLITFASTKTELQNESSAIQDKIDAKEDEISEVHAQLSDSMKQIQKLTSQITDFEGQIEKLDAEISKIEVSISETEEKLEEAVKLYTKQEEMLKQRVVALYESGETSYLDVLLSSSDLTEFISNCYLVSEITSYDTDLLDQMEKNRNDIEAAKKALEENKAQVESVKISKEETAKSLQNSKSAKQECVDKLSADEKTMQDELEQFEEDKKQVQRELAAIAAKEAANNKEYIVSTPSSSGYIFPVAGLSKANISNKSYPSYPGHTGIDVNINVVGKSIVAVKSGTVVISAALTNGNGTYRSYGEYIVINHHDGTMTLYAHGLAGSRRVSVGEEVAQGQVLMILGSTGNSTGPHLHFEVRVNRKPSKSTTIFTII